MWYNIKSIINKNYALAVIVLILVGGFYVAQYLSENKSDHTPTHVTSTTKNIELSSYQLDVKPILEKRCIVCHSCYDAPCQLKLSSVEGLTRGAKKEKIYNPRRLLAIDPTRLFVDAKTETEWRSKGFHSILDKTDNTNKSLFQLMLELKQHHPQLHNGKLPSDFTLDIDRKQECPTQRNFNQYAKKHSLWGMPYGMPNLSQQENKTLNNWLRNGAIIPESITLKNKASTQIVQWENFLNQASNKHRLMSRYIYEHIFHAHIHFKNTPSNEFYRLVRSYTPQGIAIDEIATLRPYDLPQSDKFYYRLLRYIPTVIAKNHLAYELSNQRLIRYRELFIKPDYNVKKLPSYKAKIASNPFKVFADIPPDSRYRFLLDDAGFFIEGFIKGPVCRGQIALNVIEDQFWIMFFNPDKKTFTTEEKFLDNMSDYLQLPSERGSHLNLLPIWTDYWQKQKKYMSSKQRYFKKMQKHDLDHALSYIWNGNGTNKNAALTVFRHFDSASVEYGFIGNNPETAWIIDYPLFERIHYLLVAGFNIYGNVVHQLSTRIYMDFLRMEGEDHYLSFLPASKRKVIRDTWYQGMRSELDSIFKAPMKWLNVESVIGYQTDNVQSELYNHIKKYMGNLLTNNRHINQCGAVQCNKKNSIDAQMLKLKQKIDYEMNKISKIKGNNLHDFPEVSFVRITTHKPEQSFVYSLMRNKAYKNVTSFLSDERKRTQQDIANDSLTVVNWLAGNYPNFFFNVDINDLNKFIEQSTHLKKQQDFDVLVKQFGIRRTNPIFWETADWFQQQYKKQRPLHSGIYDLSRYANL